MNAITEVEPEKLVNQLQKALGLNLPEEEVRESCAIYSYKSKREALQKVYAEGEIKTQQVLDDYLKGYNEALYVLFQPDSDSNAIKAAIQEIADHYCSAVSTPAGSAGCGPSARQVCGRIRREYAPGVGTFGGHQPMRFVD